MSELRTTSRKTRVGKVVSDKMDKTVDVYKRQPTAPALCTVTPAP